MKHVIFLLALPALAVAQELEVALDKKADSAKVAADRESVTIAIASDSGIGGAAVTPRKGVWPKTVVIRLAYRNGKGFGSLESFGLTTPLLTASGSLREDARFPFAFASGAAAHDAPSDVRTNAGSLHVSVAPRPDGMVIRLPPYLLTERQPLRFSWIDAWR